MVICPGGSGISAPAAATAFSAGFAAGAGVATAGATTVFAGAGVAAAAGAVSAARANDEKHTKTTHASIARKLNLRLSEFMADSF